MDRRVEAVNGVNPVEPVRPKRGPKGEPGRVRRRWEDFLEEESRQGGGNQPHQEAKDREPLHQDEPPEDPRGALRRVKERPTSLLEAHSPKDTRGVIIDSKG